MSQKTDYPKTIQELQAELLEHAKDGRSDALFRHAIAVDQIGSLVRHLTHDQELNPTSRPHSSKNGEISDAGHALVQLMTYCALRGIDIEEAIHIALDNLREKDFMKKVTNGKNICKGTVASRSPLNRKNEIMTGIAFVDRDCKNIDKMPMGAILISNHPESGISRYISHIGGIVTDNGGMTCHAAIVSREFGIPCITGTGNATELFKTGDRIQMRNDGVVEKCTQ